MNQAKEIKSRDNNMVNFTTREIECIEAIRNSDLVQLGNILNISSRSLQFYLDNIIYKCNILAKKK